MAKRSRNCVCCGTKYEYCPTCGNDRYLPAWKAEFCSETCKELFEVCTEFNLNIITKEEAERKLAGMELNPVETYTETLKKDIKNITSKSKHEVVTKREN